MILVAEDHEVNQIVIEQILLNAGLDFTIVDNGQLALSGYLEHRPALILMDVSMPEMNGLEAASAIREIEQEEGKGAHVVIIGVTAHALMGDKERCLYAGMDDYVTKPISSSELLEKISSWLDRQSTYEPSMFSNLKPKCLA